MKCLLVCVCVENYNDYLTIVEQKFNYLSNLNSNGNQSIRYVQLHSVYTHLRVISTQYMDKYAVQTSRHFLLALK